MKIQQNLGRIDNYSRDHAIRVLLRLGFFTKFDQKNGYVHVRKLSGGKAGEWNPDPDRAPGNNIVDNYTNLFVNHASNTQGIEQITADYGGPSEVEQVKIFADSENNYILSTDFDLSSLSDEDRTELQEALKTLGLGVLSASEISKYVPADYEARKQYNDIYNEIMNILTSTPEIEMFRKDPKTGKIESVGFTKRKFVNMEMLEYAIERVCEKQKISESNTRLRTMISETAEKIAGAINSRVMLLESPSTAVRFNASTAAPGYMMRVGLENRRGPVKRFITDPDSFGKLGSLGYMVRDEKGNYVPEVCPFSREYVSAWLQENKVVGLKYDQAGERGKVEGQSVYAFIDLDRVNSEAVIGKRLAAIINTYEKLPKEFKNFAVLRPGSSDISLSSRLKTANASGVISALDPYMRKVNGGVSLFDMPSGVSEGYTIGEHTESVLRVFEGTFEQTIPSEIVPIMKLALSVHDIGKGIATKDGKKYQQKEYTSLVCDKLFTSGILGISPELKDVVKFMIGDAQELTTEYYVSGNSTAKDTLYKKCEQILQEKFGLSDAGATQALANMCLIIQNCDSISYSQYGVIRGTHDKESGVYYHGANRTFGENVEVVGFDKRRTVLKKKDESSQVNEELIELATMYRAGKISFRELSNRRKEILEKTAVKKVADTSVLRVEECDFN